MTFWYLAKTQPLQQLMRLREQFHRLKILWGDSAYGRNELPAWVCETFGWVLQTILRPVNVQGFIVLPKRWIVERTFAWISRCRRNARDYERKPEHSEAMIHLTMIAFMSKRLANLKNRFLKQALRGGPFTVNSAPG